MLRKQSRHEKPFNVGQEGRAILEVLIVEVQRLLMVLLEDGMTFLSWSLR